MFDTTLRRALAPTLDRVGARLDDAGIAPLTLTAVGWLAGLGACGAVATRHWTVGLVLWLANRVFDGLDGPVARHRGPSDLGGFLDIVADFSIYAGFVVGVAVAQPAARLACVALLTAYYVSGAALLALSSLVERRGTARPADGRSLRFAGGVAEGTETIAAYVVFCLLPGRAEVIAWVFTAAVAFTAGQRVAAGVRTLREPVFAVDPRSVPATRPVAATPPVAAGRLPSAPKETR